LDDLESGFLYGMYDGVRRVFELMEMASSSIKGSSAY
jgi:hypothetical protein